MANKKGLKKEIGGDKNRRVSCHWLKM